jgi:formylglycine-generating enzyme required for sulfatase activity
VSFTQAVTYCGWENKRLPSEEEWETAAREDGLGGLGKYAWAVQDACFTCQNENAVRKVDSSLEKGTCAVGSHALRESKLGFKDLVGNVSEWTTGEFCDWEAKWCSEPVTRGNTWCSTLYEELTERRPGPGAPNGREPAFYGFRCARDAPNSPKQ